MCLLVHISKAKQSVCHLIQVAPLCPPVPPCAPLLNFNPLWWMSIRVYKWLETGKHPPTAKLTKHTHTHTQRQNDRRHTHSEPFRKSRVNLCAQPKPDLFLPSPTGSVVKRQSQGQGDKGDRPMPLQKKKIIINETRYKMWFFKNLHNILNSCSVLLWFFPISFNYEELVLSNFISLLKRHKHTWEYMVGSFHPLSWFLLTTWLRGNTTLI